MQRRADRYDSTFANTAMIALWPATMYAQNMAIPGGLSPDKLHLEVVTLGPFVAGDPRTQDLGDAISAVANQFSQIQANVYGHALLSQYYYQPRIGYLVSDSGNISALHDRMLSEARSIVSLPSQRSPWQPHITAAYTNNDPDALNFTGSVQFDRLALVVGGNIHFSPL